MINEFSWGEYDDDRDQNAIDPAILDEITGEPRSQRRSIKLPVFVKKEVKDESSDANELGESSNSISNHSGSSDIGNQTSARAPSSTTTMSAALPEVDDEICAVGGILSSFSSVSSDTEQTPNPSTARYDTNKTEYFHPQSYPQFTPVQGHYDATTGNILLAQQEYMRTSPLMNTPQIPTSSTTMIESEQRMNMSQQLHFPSSAPYPGGSHPGSHHNGYDPDGRMRMTSSSSSSTSPPIGSEYHRSSNAFSQSINLLSTVMQQEHHPSRMTYMQAPMRQQPSRTVKSNRYTTPMQTHFNQYSNTPLPPKKKTAWMKFAQNFERIISPEASASNRTVVPSPANVALQYPPGFPSISPSLALYPPTTAKSALLPIKEEKQANSKSTGDDENDDELEESSSDDDFDDEHQDFTLFHDFNEQDYSTKVIITDEEAENILNSFVLSLTDPVGKFMRTNDITPQQAIQLNIHRLLLQAPRKYREKYGRRREISEHERTMTNRERNREHARATRMRRKIFKEVEKRLLEHGRPVHTNNSKKRNH